MKGIVVQFLRFQESDDSGQGGSPHVQRRLFGSRYMILQEDDFAQGFSRNPKTIAPVGVGRPL